MIRAARLPNALLIHHSPTSFGEETRVPNAKTLYPSQILALEDCASTLKKVTQLVETANVRIRRKIQYNTPHGLLALPNDILAMILRLVCDSYLELSRLEGVLKICGVCRTLQEVAVNIPSLWTILCPRSRPIEAEILARSGNLPLKLTIRDIRFLNSDLLQEARRWGYLHLKCLNLKPIACKVAIVPKTILPKLVRLETDSPFDNFVFSNFSMPNLQYLSMSNSLVRTMPTEFAQTLTTCSISTLFEGRPADNSRPLGTLLTSLAQLITLSDLRLSLRLDNRGGTRLGLDLDQWRTENCHNFPSLRQFTLELTVDSNSRSPFCEGSFLLLCIDLPCLEYLDVSYRRSARDTVGVTPERFFVGGQLSRHLTFYDTLHAHGRVYPHLRSFRFQHHPTLAPIEFLSDTLPLMPRLKDLHLEGWVETILASPGVAFRPLPPLSRIQLQNTLCTAWEIALLIEELEQHHPCFEEFEGLTLPDIPSPGISEDEYQRLSLMMPGKLFVERKW